MTNYINTPYGQRLAYNQIVGKKTGIVFLSGFGSDMQGKKSIFIEKWAKRNNHSFLRFDYSGHGLSSNNLNNTVFSDWYKDAEFLINKLTFGKQILIGSSMGSWVMLMLVKRMPQKVKSIIGLASAPDFPYKLVWRELNIEQKRTLICKKKISIKLNDQSEKRCFSYNLIKDSLNNLVLKKPIQFDGKVFLYHGIKDKDVPYQASIDIINQIKGSEYIKLLLDKNGDHRLSKEFQLNQISSILDDITK